MDIGIYIKQLRQSRGLSQEELGKIVGVQRAAVQKWEAGKVQNLKRDTIKALADYFGVNPANFINVDDKPSSKGVSIPVLGTVPAGVPIEAVEEILDYEEITEAMAQQGDFFALKVKGSSMEAKISEGDVVIVRKQEDVDSGDIAIVMVNGDEATIKKVKKFEGGINLIPFNTSYDVKTYTNKDIKELPVRILGKVVELRAKF